MEDMGPQLTAFLTSSAIFCSSAAVNCVSAKEVGHMEPLSRLAESVKPKVAYLASNFCALWKKQTGLPSLLAYAGIPYQVFGDRVGALAVTTAWIRRAMALSDPFISAIFASKAFSPSALRASAFSSWRRSFIAARSWAESPVVFFVVAVVLLADLFLGFFAVISCLLWGTDDRSAR